MSVLVIAEHNNETLDEASLKTLSAGLQLEGKVDLLIPGKHTEKPAEQAAKLKGVQKVLRTENIELDHSLAEPMQDLLLGLAEHYDYFLMAASTTGKNIMPRLAAKLDVMQISDIVALEKPDCFTRPIYAGNAFLKIKSHDQKKVITVRTTAFNAVSQSDNTAPVEIIKPEFSSRAACFVGEDLSKTDRPDLTEAKIIVSGGRALGSKEEFKLIESLADQLKAAVGASRAAVDAGYAPNDWQVGQTGKIVAPELYIAIGISGAIQHIAGMKDSKIIVAINKDEDAPIFQYADYGLIGDLFKIIPELKKKLAILGYSG